MTNVLKKPKPPRAASSHGLVLPLGTLKALQKRGIYCAPGVSLEHQHLARRYVLRGVESGGAVSDMGRACAFVAENGSPLPWLHSIHSIAVNGRHAILLAESMVRIEMLRSERTWELAITFHTLSRVPERARPQIVSRSLFRGRDGVLSVDLWKEEHRALRGRLAPIFYSRAGEALTYPPSFEDAIRKTTAAACCIGCKHTHVGVPPTVVNHEQGTTSMTDPNQVAVTVGEPNWAPLECAVPAKELENFMYMGCAGEIELYKHRFTRRYLNIGRNSERFYRYLNGDYVEISRAAALEHVRS